MTTRLVLTLFAATALSLLASSCSSSPPPTPTPDFPATVQAAVAEALATERAKPTVPPGATREEWLTAGREFLTVEIDAEELVSKFNSAVLSLVLSNPPKPDINGYLDASMQRRKLVDRLYLIPLPHDSDGESIRTSVSEATKSLIAFEGVVGKHVLSPVAESPDKPGTQDPRYLEAYQQKSAFDVSWRAARTRLLVVLQQKGISMADIGQVAMSRPTSTPAPVPPANTAIEMKKDDPQYLSSGAVVASGSLRNNDKTWTATEVKVTVRAKDGSGKQVLEEQAHLLADSIRPGAETQWEYVFPASIKWDSASYEAGWKWALR